MNIEDYENLPDRLPKEQIYSYFKGAIDDFKQKKSKDEFLEILTALMERQIMTYELLEEPLHAELDELISSLWNTENYNDVDIILSLIVNLGLEKSFEKVKSSISVSKSITPEILAEIKETIEDVGDHFANPYYDLEQK
ncbi:hypothetical protein [Bacillus pseudomycoides]|uniref:Immunity protein 30 domain-containing protein n=1 Tax=Bacillus pseudomycoides TaxID=64104 RepID=A0ABD6SV66_9BACI|nr:hypothetical protein [Bacillus pseudomycoides]EEM01997.1 hypothetical protein bmyco0002_56790 [Bacillus pseudomycoides]KFN10261.1 hypothetical protein DJ94_5470 [Bacillus pseudomycoides]MDR4185750.1 hypothetical protein [Bacillus pseudomycoides]MED0856756.1 hypothetical protein [Bacillus pseudomycoides]PEJ22161.1 hypothetical protein CN887_23395 [Bacillus pseudomycoides]